MPNTTEQTSESPSANERFNHCFGCGPNNPQGMHLSFAIDTADPTHITSTTTVQLTRVYQGPPGFIHGGIIATLMDEAMGKLNRPLNVTAMTRHMEIDYLRPAPLDQPLTLVGTHLSRNGRKLFHQAELRLADGTVLARAKGLFIALSSDHISSPQKP
jgi:acyl-coenzyme A thioesterase PaaI-like protein